MSSRSHYFALIGDMVSSRHLRDRASAQKRLREAVDQANRTFGPSFALPLRVTAGDEVQVLLRTPSAVMELLTLMADALHPASMVWGLGFGPLATDLADDISLVDGPCMHRARDAVEQASREDKWLHVDGIPEPTGSAVAAMVSLIGAVRSDWTDTRRGYVRAARERTQRDVAEQFSVNESTVSRALAAAHFQRVLEAEAAAGLLLRRALLHAPPDGDIP